MAAYYNEIDRYAAQWLRNLIAAGLIAPGDVDERSITEVRPDDLAGYTQCHFFAGIGGWSYALRLAGWPDDRPAWTGSCPCQPFSVAGKQKGFDDERHLWPIWRELIRLGRPPVVFGEQVASAAQWLNLVRSDLESMGSAVGCLPIQAACAGAFHYRDRYFFVGHSESHQQWGNREPKQSEGPQEQAGGYGSRSNMADPASAGSLPGAHPGIHSGEEGPRAWDGEPERCGIDMAHAERRYAAGRMQGATGQRETDNGRGDKATERGADAGIAGGFEFGNSLEWLIGADGKTRPVKPGIRLLANGVPARVGKLRAFGNAIYPQVAAEFIKAYMEISNGNR